jgi:hypothetical protein
MWPRRELAPDQSSSSATAWRSRGARSHVLTDRIARLMLYEPPLHEPVDNNLAVGAWPGDGQEGALEQARRCSSSSLI